MSPQSTPRLDEPQATMAFAQYRVWVRTGIVLLLIGYSASAGSHLLGPDVVLGDVWSEVVAIGGILAALALLSRGMTRVAALLSLAVFWSELHVSAFRMGELLFSGTPVLPVLVVAVGLFLGGRAAIISALVTSITFPAAVQLGASVIGRGPGLAPEIVAAVVLPVALLGAAAVMHVGLIAFGTILTAERANERKFSLLVEHAPAGIVLLDDSGQVGSLNPAAERILGLSEAEASGRPFAELVQRLAPDTTSLDEILVPGEQSREVSIRHADGRPLRVEYTTIETVRADGSPGLQVTLVDVTHRKEAEERAIQLGELIDRSPSEIYVMDPQTLALRLVNLGARKNLGYSTENVVGLSMNRVNPTLTRERAEVLIEEERHAPEGRSHRAVHRRRNGTAYPVEFRMHDATFAGGAVLVVSALDITDRVAAEEEQDRLRTQLQQAQKMEAVGQLAGGVAHDFNNLLMAIGGYAEMLEQTANDPRSKKWASEIRRSQERGASLTRKLLSFARRDVAQPRVLSLGEVLDEIRPILDRLLGERIALRMESAGDDYVFADPTQLEQLLVHLASNSMDAMPHGGTISVLVHPEEERAGRVGQHPRHWVVLEFRDDGTGMDEPTRRRVFDPFFSTKPRSKGTGLGLATVHSIVVHNGGRIDVRSNPGVGTTFEIWWPAAERPSGRAAGEGRRTPPDLGRPGTVLVVEDDEGTRGVVEIVLNRAGHEVAAAASAEEGQELLDELGGRVDVLLTDVVLPGRSGFELARYVRETYPAVRILFMSGYLDDLLPDSGEFDTGADLLLKPFSTTDLLRRVSEALPNPRR